MKDFDERVRKTFIFVSKLLFAGLVFQLILFINPSTYQVQVAFASLISYLISLAGIEAVQSGIRIFTDEAVYVVVQDCLGWKSLAAFIGLLWASTKRTLEHLNFIIAGLSVLILANVVRVFSTVYLAEIGIISFDIIHGVLWRWSLTVVVLALWLYWMKSSKKQAKFESRIKSKVEDYRLE